ncbi:MAG: hypothetical protein WCC96_12910, partial [Rhodomicrobium sp.]
SCLPTRSAWETAPPEPEALPAFVMQENYGHNGVSLALAKGKGRGWKCRVVVWMAEMDTSTFAYLLFKNGEMA